MSNTSTKVKKKTTSRKNAEPKTSPTKSRKPKHDTSTEYTVGMRYIHDNLIGNHAMITGPYGKKRMTYADYTASGRSLYMIENYIAKYVLSYYGNTHTATSFASAQTTRFREEAKNIIRKACSTSDEDVVIFSGSGATSAINKLIYVLDLINKDKSRETVVFIGPYEHHSNILPWKETGAKIVRIKESKTGELDMNHLREELSKYDHKDYYLKIGTFSACSNVTGIMVDTIAVTETLHQYNTLAFWDYASGAPYLKIDMNPPPATGEKSSKMAYKDAIFCSPHKFVGGPGSPGLLIAKKKLFVNQVPHGTGGGTVLFVTPKKHSYIPNIEEREEGGTPGIIESIRAGLVFHLKHSVGLSNIHAREQYLVKKAMASLTGNKNIILLGNNDCPRLPIFSFAVRHGNSKKLVHHNFIALLLNDLFGIQARGGCACAGPYAQDLLGIAEEVSEALVWLLDLKERRSQAKDDQVKVAESLGIMKPGFVRVNLGYFMTDEETDFILSAIHIVANQGWTLLPQYICDMESGNWSHRTQLPHFHLMSLYDIDYRMNDAYVGMTVVGTVNPKSEKLQAYNEIMTEARKVLDQADVDRNRYIHDDDITMKDILPETLFRFIWWLEPHYAIMFLNKESNTSIEAIRQDSIPIKPRKDCRLECEDADCDHQKKRSKNRLGKRSTHNTMSSPHVAYKSSTKLPGNRSSPHVNGNTSSRNIIHTRTESSFESTESVDRKTRAVRSRIQAYKPKQARK